MVFQTTPTSPGVLVFWVRPNSRFTQVNIHLHRCFETTKRRVQQFRFRVSRGLTPKMGRSRREPQKSPKKWTAPKFLLGVTYAIKYRYIYSIFGKKWKDKKVHDHFIGSNGTGIFTYMNGWLFNGKLVGKHTIVPWILWAWYVYRCVFV